MSIVNMLNTLGTKWQIPNISCFLQLFHLQIRQQDVELGLVASRPSARLWDGWLGSRCFWKEVPPTSINVSVPLQNDIRWYKTAQVSLKMLEDFGATLKKTWATNLMFPLVLVFELLSNSDHISYPDWKVDSHWIHVFFQRFDGLV